MPVSISMSKIIRDHRKKIEEEVNKKRKFKYKKVSLVYASDELAKRFNL